MKSVTITLDEETAHWAKVEAAKAGTSLSRMLGEMLEQRRLAQVRHEQALNDFMARSPKRLNQAETPLPVRDQVHERQAFRQYERE